MPIKVPVIFYFGHIFPTTPFPFLIVICLNPLTDVISANANPQVACNDASQNQTDCLLLYLFYFTSASPGLKVAPGSTSNGLLTLGQYVPINIYLTIYSKQVHCMSRHKSMFIIIFFHIDNMLCMYKCSSQFIRFLFELLNYNSYDVRLHTILHNVVINNGTMLFSIRCFTK